MLGMVSESLNEEIFKDSDDFIKEDHRTMQVFPCSLSQRYDRHPICPKITPRLNQTPLSFQDSSQNRRLKKYENDDIPQEKVVRIYQEELAKIMTRRVEDMRHSRDGFPT